MIHTKYVALGTQITTWHKKRLCSKMYSCSMSEFLGIREKVRILVGRIVTGARVNLLTNYLSFVI